MSFSARIRFNRVFSPRPFAACIVTWLVILVTGCATHDPADSGVASASHPRWEALFLPESAQQAPTDSADHWSAHNRNDHQLAIRVPRQNDASDQWPNPARPSLDRARYIYLQRQPESILYLRPAQDFDHRRDW